MSRINEPHLILCMCIWTCKCRSGVKVYNNKPLNSGKRRCECKELIDNGRFDDEFI